MLLHESIYAWLFAATGYAFFVFAAMAICLVALGVVPRARAMRERRTTFALSLIAAAGMVATGWPFCELLLLPWLAAAYGW